MRSANCVCTNLVSDAGGGEEAGEGAECELGGGGERAGGGGLDQGRADVRSHPHGQGDARRGRPRGIAVLTVSPFFFFSLVYLSNPIYAN